LKREVSPDIDADEV